MGKELSTIDKLNNEIGKVKFENNTCHRFKFFISISVYKQGKVGLDEI